MSAQREPAAGGDRTPAKPDPDDPADDSALDSIGKAVTSPVRSAAEPEEPTPGEAPPAPG